MILCENSNKYVIIARIYNSSSIWSISRSRFNFHWLIYTNFTEVILEYFIIKTFNSSAVYFQVAQQSVVTYSNSYVVRNGNRISIELILSPCGKFNSSLCFRRKGIFCR